MSPFHTGPIESRFECTFKFARTDRVTEWSEERTGVMHLFEFSYEQQFGHFWFGVMEFDGKPGEFPQYFGSGRTLIDIRFHDGRSGTGSVTGVQRYSETHLKIAALGKNKLRDPGL